MYRSVGVDRELFGHDAKAAVLLAFIACLTFGFAYVAGQVSQKKLADSLRQMGAAEEIVKSLR